MDWRPYEPCREHEEEARREREIGADAAMFEDAARAHVDNAARRAAELRERIKGLR